MRAVRFIAFILIISVFSAGCSWLLDPEPQVYINEFMASNKGVETDPMHHTAVDWIEIYNASDYVVDIGGYYLTDNKDDTTKWKFPAETLINAKSYLLVWADGTDTLLHTNFKLSRKGEEIALFSKNKDLLDFVKYKDQQTNISFGRKWDGKDGWVYFDTPSPNFTNILQKGIKKFALAEEPVFSLEAGFYDSTILVTLSAPNDNSQIRYTLNGEMPNRSSELYTKPLEITKTTVVRAINVEKKKLNSNSVTRTYFINEDKNLPVASLVVNPDALWDQTEGIYKNSIKRQDRLANFEFFEDQSEVINQLVKMSISGNIARFHGQKAILLAASENLGNATLDHRFFPDKRIYSFQSLLLRAGGHPDKYYTMFRDGMIQSLSIDQIDIDYVGYRPIVVFLNGEYWGIYNIREKLNSNYFLDNHKLEQSHLNLLENSWAVANDGNNWHYKKTIDFVKECNKKDLHNYNYAKSLMDMDNYINYYIFQIYAANIDWPNWNIKFWKPEEERAKWKWVLVDLDYGFGAGTDADFNMIGYTSSPVKTRSTNPPNSTILFRKLLEFPYFMDEFLQRFAASINVVFAPERVLGKIKELEEERYKEMPLHLDRWKDSIYRSPWGKFKMPQSMDEWDNKIEVMRDFARRRPDIVRRNLLEKFNLDGMVDLTTISDGGHITINTIDIGEGMQKGKYFKGLPTELEAIPNPGQKFKYWIVDGKTKYSQIISYTPRGTGNIKAFFEDANQTKLPDTISKNTTLSAANSPYYTIGDVVVNPDVTLTIEKGVHILMAKHRSIIVFGGFTCNGTEKEPILITPNANKKSTEWGALCIDHATFPIKMEHVELQKGSWYDDQKRYKATITSYNSTVSLDNVTVESSYFPFYSEYGIVSIKNSKMTSPKTCDLINIKYAESALVENCDLPGNDYPDTDAIDYDGIFNGAIRNNTIYGFFGFNSDAIDIGEASSDIIIEGNRIYNMTDKGISIGQKSSAIIKNNLIYGCSMGVGIKDSNSFAYIDHNTFIANKFGVAVFEKNRNAGGGGAEVLNCIFYKSKKKPVEIDDMSWVSIINSLSSEREMDGRNNKHGDPEFNDINNFDFSLKDSSPAKNAGTGVNKDLGAVINIPKNTPPDIIINEINLSPVWKNGALYWIELYNNSDSDIDLTGWTIKNENHDIYNMPQKLIIKKNGYIILTNNDFGFYWHYSNMDEVREVFDFKLIKNGKELILYDELMNKVDYVKYENLISWPDKIDKTGVSLELKATTLNNDESENWQVDVNPKGSPGAKNK